MKEIVTHSQSSSSDSNVQGCAKLTEFPHKTLSPVKSQKRPPPSTKKDADITITKMQFDTLMAFVE